MAGPARDGRRLGCDELIRRAEVQDVHGVTVLVAALDDVIASKEWADRPKDRSSFFDDGVRFPAATAMPDSAFLMANLATTWRAEPALVASQEGRLAPSRAGQPLPP